MLSPQSPKNHQYKSMIIKVILPSNLKNSGKNTCSLESIIMQTASSWTAEQAGEGEPQPVLWSEILFVRESRELDVLTAD